MTLTEIKQAIAIGKKVYWSNHTYSVVKDANGQYLIVCYTTGYTLGLTWADDETLNGKESDFLTE